MEALPSTTASRAPLRSRVGWYWIAAAVVVSCWGLMLLDIVALVNTAEDACPMPGTDSGSFGLYGWSWLPPGPTCTIPVVTETGASPTDMTIVVGMGWYSVLTVVLLITSSALLIAYRPSRRASPPVTPLVD